MTVPPKSFVPSSIDALYAALRSVDSDANDDARLVLTLRQWLYDVVEIDPNDGEALPSGIVNLLDRAVATSTSTSDADYRDRVYHVAAYTQEAVQALVRRPNGAIIREHKSLPLRSVREIDIQSFRRLSRRPGRTIREKLADNPTMIAPQRRETVNTTENRLFHAFLTRVTEILHERARSITSDESSPLSAIQYEASRWLRTEEASEIQRWENVLPNNTLLEDRNYRKIWTAWRWLSRLDEDIARDSAKVENDLLSFVFWQTIALLHRVGGLRVMQTPLFPDYHTFKFSENHGDETNLTTISGYVVSQDNTDVRLGTITERNEMSETARIDGHLFHKDALSPDVSWSELENGQQYAFELNEGKHGRVVSRIFTSVTGDSYFRAEFYDNQVTFKLANRTITVDVDKEQPKVLRIQAPSQAPQLIRITSSNLSSICERIASQMLVRTITHPKTTARPTSSAKHTVIDLSSLRPRLSRDGQEIEQTKELLVAQRWGGADEATKVYLDGFGARALSSNNNGDVITATMWSVLSSNKNLPDGERHQFVRIFARQLAERYPTEQLTYILPDWANDFELQPVRSAIHTQFRAAAPLPRSIGAVFDWHQAQIASGHTPIADKTVVLVCDIYHDGLAITPVTPVYDENLKKELPESAGIQWVRHPVFKKPIDGFNEALIQHLRRADTNVSESELSVFGLEGILELGGRMSLIDDDGWRHLPEVNKAQFLNSFPKPLLTPSIIKEILAALPTEFRSQDIWLLRTSELIQPPETKDRKYRVITHEPQPARGANALKDWQDRVPERPLWKDHLPELSIKVLNALSLFIDFPLVKNQTIAPRRGASVTLPIKSTFTLPKGVSRYEFPLFQQGSDGTLTYQAILESRAFPLPEDTACRLTMTYTYGNEQPYRLTFHPIARNASGFKQVEVKWEPVGEQNYEHLLAPNFPQSDTWDDLAHYPQSDGEGTPDDLFEWTTNSLSPSNGLEHYAQRFRARVTGPVRTNDKGNRFFFVEREKYGDDLYCNEHNLIDRDEINNVVPGTIVFLNEKKFKGRIVAADISLDEEMSEKERNLILNRLGKTLRDARFPVYTIWNHGRSLSHPNAPSEFRQAIAEAQRFLLNLYFDDGLTDELRDEAFHILCCMHADTPSEIPEELHAISQDPALFQRFHRQVAYAIGDAQIDWQKKLLSRVIYLAIHDPELRTQAITTLAIAFWRSEHALLQLDASEMRRLSELLLPETKHALNNARKNGHSWYFTDLLCKHLELLLALIRTRTFKDPAFSQVLAPYEPLTDAYLELSEEVHKATEQNGLQLKSRITLRLDRPPEAKNIPDLLYAINMYLTGSDGAKSIIVDRVSDD